MHFSMTTKNINSQPEFAETDTFSEICVCNGWSEYGPLHSGCNTCMAVAVYYFCCFVDYLAHCCVPKGRNREKTRQGYIRCWASILCTQTQWFIDKRVDTVKKMLSSNGTGLAPLECIDLLLVECDNKLKSTRPSELIQKRIKPTIIPMTIIILSLITAWINIMVPEMNISFEDSFSKYFLSVMQVLASNIILSRTLMVSFVAICVYATAIYLAIVFVIFPAVMSFVDREFLLASELRDVLLYIKHDDSFVKQGTTCASEK